MDTVPPSGPPDPQARRLNDPDLYEDKDPLTYEVIGAAIEVHRELGPGYIERVYETALAHEMTLRGIPFAKQLPVPIIYKGVRVGRTRLDFIVRDELVLEIKSVSAVAPIHVAQTLSYLRVTRKRKALLLNFNEVRLRDGVKRLVM